MKPDAQSDRVLLEHIGECIERIREYTGSRRASFYGSPWSPKPGVTLTGAIGKAT